MKKYWKFTAKGGDTGELAIYGDIVGSASFEDDISPQKFSEELRGLGNIKNLNVYINSSGGDVFAGQTIYSMLKRHQARKTVFIDGVAASIASVIAMVGDTIIAPVNSMLMIHTPWTFVAGNANELRKVADDLDKVGETVINVYEERTGLPRKKIIDLMREETWLTAEEAVTLGFADRLDPAKQIAASISGRYATFGALQIDTGKFKNVEELRRKLQATPAFATLRELYLKDLQLMRDRARRYNIKVDY